ncbi:unnamed protein product [Sympodiomycopsis kandeliae]
MPTIEDDFDDDTDFALPAPPTSSGPSNPAGGGMPSIPGMPNLSPEQMQAFQQMMSQGGGGGMPPGMGMGGMGTEMQVRPTPRDIQSESQDPNSAASKKWITLYPIYFDTKKSHKVGERRVAWRQSCLFPHSLGIAKSVSRLNLKFSHEPGKTHPRDWENPGRVKVQIFNEETDQPIKLEISNKNQLIKEVAKIMQTLCGGPPPIAIPKREKKQNSKKVQKQEQSAVASSSKTGKKPATSTPSTATPSSKPLSSLEKHSAGTSSRLNQLHRYQQLQPYMPPPHIKLPPHSPSMSADLLNMDMNKAMNPGGANAQAGGQPNPMGALGSMMGNLGFGEDEEQDNKQKEEEEKKKQNDPFRGMGRRGRKRVVRVGR